MKRLHRTTIALAAAAAAALTLSSCTQGGGSAEPSADGKPVTVTFQSFSDQPAAIQATKEIVDAWNKDHPDVTVEIVQAPTDSLDDKLTTQFAGGVAPDIIHYEVLGIVPFARDGYLADLTGLLDKKTMDDIDPGVLESVTVDGQIIGAPTELQTYVVFANKKLLDAAGVAVPTGDSMSWDELATIAKATTTGDVHGITWGLKSPTAAFMSLGMGFGSTYFTGEGDAMKVAVKDADLEVPNRVKAMIQEGSVDPIGVTQSGSDVLATFYAGKAAMTVQGSYQVANIATDAPADMDWVVLPPLAGSKGAVQAANPQTLSINVDSPHQKQAAAFLDYFMQTDNLVKMNIADGLIPTTVSAREALAKQTADKKGWPAIVTSAEGLRGPAFLQANGFVRWKDTVATPAFQKFLGGETDDKALTSELDDGWAQVNG
ncbi:ABC-type glycerol-3-phosphate transport system substrate-binding protein [Microbacterium resistens]|uniref:ABC-type glycerol-3-phosphate transport system substrate-binding protein n=1 Tax=Microbacterium resistens TaxID=156977 RepID=A0ABU1SEU0_9MICO|nr:sugar ABC transporter substrate-binding protein [Microbacterium resistens]MDR6868121.1 ABC-type glycerol-3-phosphate transport system substrate-binding protein [Microbacterium resistens]